MIVLAAWGHSLSMIAQQPHGPLVYRLEAPHRRLPGALLALSIHTNERKNAMALFTAGNARRFLASCLALIHTKRKDLRQLLSGQAHQCMGLRHMRFPLLAAGSCLRARPSLFAPFFPYRRPHIPVEGLGVCNCIERYLKDSVGSASFVGFPSNAPSPSKVIRKR